MPLAPCLISLLWMAFVRRIPSRILACMFAPSRSYASPLDDSAVAAVAPTAVKDSAETIRRLHSEACNAGKHTYIDPKTGFSVFTRLAHEARGYCCGSGCRHCPYGHVNVKTRSRGVEGRLSRRDPIDIDSGSGVKSKVYTRTGDAGSSCLFDGSSASKGASVFELLGGMDELSSAVGVARASLSEEHTAQLAAWHSSTNDVLVDCQRALFRSGALVADPSQSTSHGPILATLEERVAAMESTIDAIDAALPPLNDFVLPGPPLASAALHLARSICRRVERDCVRLNAQNARAAESGDPTAAPIPAQLGKFLNRMSDFLFVVARGVAHCDRVGDVLAKPACK